MKKLALALVVALGLGGCAQLQSISGALSVATASITNPVTPQMLYNAENGITIAIAGLQAYKRSCIEGVADVNCRANIRKIQVYTRQLPMLLVNLRGFVKSNDQVNASVTYNAVVQLVDGLKAAAVASGIQTGG